MNLWVLAQALAVMAGGWVVLVLAHRHSIVNRHRRLAKLVPGLKEPGKMATRKRAPVKELPLIEWDVQRISDEDYRR